MFLRLRRPSLTANGPSVMARRVLGILVASMIAITGGLASASPAQAADHTLYTTDGNPGARVEFTANGDVVKLCDIEADGWGAYVFVRDVNTASVRYEIKVGGNGNCVQHDAGDGGNYDLTEGHRFEFHICLLKGTMTFDYCDTAFWWN